jgi:hypothetical protein
VGRRSDLSVVREYRRSPRWLATQHLFEAGRLLGASDKCRAAQFGILKQLSVAFSSGEFVHHIPVTSEDLAFGSEDLRVGAERAVAKR